MDIDKVFIILLFFFKGITGASAQEAKDGETSTC
jgi:hypothetical protein